MKKTLAAIIVSAFAASAANAAIVYENEGTKVEVSGSLRIALEKANQGIDNKTEKNSHTRLFNEGSRVDLHITHQINDQFYALGHYQVRFDDTDNNANDGRNDNFGSLNTRKAYVGFGLKHSDAAYSEVTAGRQDLIMDDVGLADDYLYGLLPKGSLGPTTKKDAVRYDYYLNQENQNLQFNLGYVFGETRDATNNLTDGQVKNAFEIGALYDVKAGPGKILVETAYAHTNYKVPTSEKATKNGYGLSLGYDLDGYIFSVDGGYFRAKNATDVTYSGKSKGYYVSPGFQAPVIKVDGKTVSRLYGNYLFAEQKERGDAVYNARTKTRGFLLGADYKLHKYVTTYVEGKYVTEKAYTAADTHTKTHDKAIGVGMRVFF